MLDDYNRVGSGAEYLSARYATSTKPGLTATPTTHAWPDHAGLRARTRTHFELTHSANKWKVITG